jgi:hypothetical protein
MEMFVYLKVGLSFVLCFVGVKMLVVDLYKIPIGVSLGVVAGILILSVVVSLLVQWKEEGTVFSRLGFGRLTVQEGQNRWHPLRATPVVNVWVLILLVGAVLAIVKWDSIADGPSGDDAVAVIRVVQRQLAEAEISHGRSRSQILSNAQATLEHALANLESKRYEEAIASAQKAKQLLGTLER